MTSEENRLRRKKIIEIIKEYPIKTQSELSEKLIENGFKITQATISRDIKKLNLIKKRNGADLIYTILDDIDSSNSNLLQVMKSSIIKLDIGMNILVVHTNSGMANACCLAIENIKFKEILGTIAGEDTIIIVTQNIEDCNILYNKLKIYIGWN